MSRLRLERLLGSNWVKAEGWGGPGGEGEVFEAEKKAYKSPDSILRVSGSLAV